MEPKILSYDDVIKNTEGTDRILLLGNGFSMAYDNKRFSYTSLLSSALESGIIKRNSPLHKAFILFETKDFETIIKALENAEHILQAYNYKSIAEIKKDAENLKTYLVKVITNNHPDKCTDISNSEYLSAIKFISQYNRIFTLNYDLLLYWTTMKYKELVETKQIKETLDISDGFASTDKNEEYVRFISDPNILYLHGGLHIFDKGDSIVKNTYSRTDVPLKEQTLSNLKKDIYPVFISEGSCEQKLYKVMHNAYLNVCYRRLEKLSKTKPLIIFGSKLTSGDKHIRDAIMGSNCESIYFPVSSKKQLKENGATEFLHAAEHAKKPKEVFFYDYHSVNVWGKK